MMPVPPTYRVPHLWIVISAPDPNGLILIVNVTHDWIRAGREYILPPRCHRRVPDESYVNFPDALAVVPEKIGALVGKIVTLEQSFDPSHVTGIIAVAKATKAMSDELKGML